MRNKQKLGNYQASNKILINYCEIEVLANLITNIYITNIQFYVKVLLFEIKLKNHYILMMI